MKLRLNRPNSITANNICTLKEFAEVLQFMDTNLP